MKKKIKNWIEFKLFQIGLALFSKLPFYITRNIMVNLFVFGGYYLGIRKEVARKNLNYIFPEMDDNQIKKIIKEIFRNFGKSAAEIYFQDSARLLARVGLEGWENLENALEKGKGVLLASAHIGNWELSGNYIASRHRMGVIYKEMRNKYFNEYTFEKRLKNGIVQINKKTGLRQILKLLKQNYIITIMVDQNAGKKGIWVDFLGKPASTFVGTAKIALKTGAPVIPAVGIRRDSRHYLIFGEALNPDDYKNVPNSETALTAAINERIGKFVLEYPGQWFWVHRRWRGRSNQAGKEVSRDL